MGGHDPQHNSSCSSKHHFSSRHLYNQKSPFDTGFVSSLCPSMKTNKWVKAIANPSRSSNLQQHQTGRKHTTTLFFFFFSSSMLENENIHSWYLVPEPLASPNAACKIPLTHDCRGSHKLYRAYHNHRTQHHPKSHSLGPDTCKWNQLEICQC